MTRTKKKRIRQFRDDSINPNIKSNKNTKSSHKTRSMTRPKKRTRQCRDDSSNQNIKNNKNNNDEPLPKRTRQCRDDSSNEIIKNNKNNKNNVNPDDSEQERRANENNNNNDAKPLPRRRRQCRDSSDPNIKNNKNNNAQTKKRAISKPRSLLLEDSDSDQKEEAIEVHDAVYCHNPVDNESVYVINDSHQTLSPQSRPHWRCRCRTTNIHPYQVLPHPLFLVKCLECGATRPTQIDPSFEQYIEISAWNNVALMKEYEHFFIIDY